MALSLYKHNQYGTLSYEQVDSNWDDIESDVNGLSSRLPLNNYSATTNPTVNDDVTQGYSNGSLWYNRTTDTAFVLTNASSGAANWVERDSISAADLGSAAFADILGTVSQSGGVPTGAIVETGSNANGEYVKFADGTMICTKSVSLAGNDNNAFVLADEATASFFSDVPYYANVSAYAADGGVLRISEVRVSPTTSVWNIVGRFNATASSATTVNYRLISIGPWFT